MIENSTGVHVSSDDSDDIFELGFSTDGWLLGGVMPTRGFKSGPEQWQEDAAMEAVMTAAMVVDGKTWLSGANFDTILCFYSWESGKSRAPRITIEPGQLTFKASIDSDSTPGDKEQLTMFLFKRVLSDLDDIASAVDLPTPTIAFEALARAEWAGQEAARKPHLAEPDFYPPVSDYAASDVGSELDALEPNEVLLVLRYRQDDETDGQAFNRRLLQEEALSRLLGAPLASSKCGDAYAIAYPLPPDRTPTKARRSRRKS